MANFEKHRQKQKAVQSTLLSTAFEQSKDNKLQPTQGSVAVKEDSYFSSLKAQMEDDRRRTVKLQRERTECISATRRKLKMRSDAVALAVSVEHDDEDDEERAEEDVPDSDLSKHPHDKPSVSGHELEVVYRETLRVIINRRGVPSSASNPADAEMYAHLQQVFNLDNETHQRLLAKELAAEKPKYYLQATVISGEELEAKDENGLSDPYCILGVSHLDDEQRRKRDAGKKTKYVTELTDNTHKTTVKHKTLSPQWNEDFRFPVDDLTNVFLQVDLWDHDDDEGVGDALKRGSSIKGFRGFGRYLHNVGEAALGGTKDDFMGRVFIPLERINQSGEDKWYSLESKRSSTAATGQLRLKLSFIRDRNQTTASLDPEWPPRRVYETLYWDCVRHDIADLQQKGIFRWKGKLPQVAKSLLELFRVQQGIRDVQHLAREWQVLAEAQKRHGVKFARLIQCIDALSAAYSRSEGKGERLEEAEIKDLFGSMDTFVTTTLELLGKQRDVFPPNKLILGGTPAVRRLSNLLVSLSSVYAFKGYANFFPQRAFKDDITKLIQDSTVKWFEQVEALAAPTTSTTAARLRQLMEVVQLVKTDLVDAGDYYEHEYKELGVPYFQVVFKTLDGLVCSRVMQKMEELSANSDEWLPHTEEGQAVGSASFQLFIAVQGVNKYCKDHFPSDSMANSQLSNFHTWFEPFVPVWLSVAEMKAVDMVQKAVELDRAVKASNALQYGTSAVDTGSIIKQLCTHFHDLDWPEDKARFKYMIQTYDSCLSVLKCYAKYIEKKLRDVGYYDVVGQFDISVELTTTLNGLDHSSMILASLPSELHWTKYTACTDEESGKTAEELQTQMLEKHVNDTKATRRKIVDQIGVRMSPDVKAKISHFMDLSNSGASLEDGLDALMVYLMENLKMLMKELIPETFMEILEEIYRVGIRIFYDVVTKNEEGRKEPPKQATYKMIQAGLEAMLDFFECNGHGLSREQLNIPDYTATSSYIHLFCADNLELCKRYYRDVVQHQDKAGKNFGKVTVAIAYEKSREMLHVEVLHAQGLPAMDLNDSSDPFFVLEIRPILEGSGKPMQHKTKVQKKTLMPLYDEKFTFQLASAEQGTPGTCVRLICYDWDRITKNDVIGESFVAAQGVPLIDSPSEFKDNSQSITVPILRPGQSVGKAYQILSQRRSYDAQAAALVDEREAFFKEMKSDSKLGLSHVCA